MWFIELAKPQILREAAHDESESVCVCAFRRNDIETSVQDQINKLFAYNNLYFCTKKIDT